MTPDKRPTVDLSSLHALRRGWDSYGAEPISEQAIATAQAVAFVPTVDGGVQIELHAGSAEIEIEIRADGYVESVIWARPRNA